MIKVTDNIRNVRDVVFVVFIVTSIFFLIRSMVLSSYGAKPNYSGLEKREKECEIYEKYGIAKGKAEIYEDIKNIYMPASPYSRPLNE